MPNGRGGMRIAALRTLCYKVEFSKKIKSKFYILMIKV